MLKNPIEQGSKPSKSLSEPRIGMMLKLPSTNLVRLLHCCKDRQQMIVALLMQSTMLSVELSLWQLAIIKKPCMTLGRP